MDGTASKHESKLWRSWTTWKRWRAHTYPQSPTRFWSSRAQMMMCQGTVPSKLLWSLLPNNLHCYITLDLNCMLKWKLTVNLNSVGQLCTIINSTVLRQLCNCKNLCCYITLDPNYMLKWKLTVNLSSVGQLCAISINSTVLRQLLHLVIVFQNESSLFSSSEASVVDQLHHHYRRSWRWPNCVTQKVWTCETTCNIWNYYILLALHNWAKLLVHGTCYSPLLTTMSKVGVNAQNMLVSSSLDRIVLVWICREQRWENTCSQQLHYICMDN